MIQSRISNTFTNTKPSTYSPIHLPIKNQSHIKIIFKNNWKTLITSPPLFGEGGLLITSRHFHVYVFLSFVFYCYCFFKCLSLTFLRAYTIYTHIYTFVFVVYIYIYLCIYLCYYNTFPSMTCLQKPHRSKNGDISPRFLATKAWRYPRSWWYFHKTLGFCMDFGLFGDCSQMPHVWIIYLR